MKLAYWVLKSLGAVFQDPRVNTYFTLCWLLTMASNCLFLKCTWSVAQLLKSYHPKRKIDFQPCIFRGFVTLRGCSFALTGNVKTKSAGQGDSRNPPIRDLGSHPCPGPFLHSRMEKSLTVSRSCSCHASTSDVSTALAILMVHVSATGISWQLFVGEWLEAFWVPVVSWFWGVFLMVMFFFIAQQRVNSGKHWNVYVHCTDG